MLWIKAVWTTVAIAILYFLVRSLVVNWHRLDISLAEVRWGWLAASAVAFVSSYALSALLWRKSLALFDTTPGYRDCLEIIILSQLPKYLPGGIWAVVGQVELSKRAGVRRSTGVLGVGMMSAAVVASGLVFGLIGQAPVIALGPARVAAVAVGVVLLAVVMHPAVFARIVGTTFVVLGKEPPPMSFSGRDVAKLLLAGLVYWPVAGLAFYALAGAVTRVATADALPFAAAFAVSWTIGYVAVFAPGGIGIRETVLVLFLSKIVGLPAAILVSLGQRVWFTIMELVTAGLWLALRRFRLLRK